MRYDNVCLESIGYTIPDEILTSTEVEDRLEPLYRRLRLPAGRLALMTGIHERRFWEHGTLPGDMSIRSARLALESAQHPPARVGALIHGSVCRDHLEPATACRVHHELDLPGDCTIYDTSNACLGILNGMAQVANMIELGQIESALVVGSEGSRQLVETTIDQLNHDERWSRKTVKLAVASLTIGSASCAVLLTHRKISQTQCALQGGAIFANTAHHRLCHSGHDEAVADGMSPMMTTDSEALLREGIATGVSTFDRFQSELSLTGADLQRTFCHQVGSAHRKLMLESLHLDAERDFITYPWLGNTGSAALPITLAIGAENGRIEDGMHVGLLGIGSGINCVMLGVEWRQVPIASTTQAGADASAIAAAQ